MPNDKEDLELSHSGAFKAAFGPRPFTKGILKNSDIIDVEYKIPDGLTEEQAMLATIGAVMDEKIMEKVENGSSGSGTILDWKRTFLVRDYLLNDEVRAVNYTAAINEGRKLAKKAFEEFSKGNPAKVNEMMARASAIIRRDFLRSAVDSGKKWFNTEAAMTLVVKASNSEEMKKVTGIDDNYQKLFEEKVRVAKLEKEKFVIKSEFAKVGKSKLKEIPDYEAKLLKLSANDRVLKAYGKEMNSMVSSADKLGISERLPTDEKDYPKLEYFTHDGFTKWDEDVLLKHFETHPHKVAEALKNDDFINDVMENIKATEDFKKAANAGRDSVFLHGFNVSAPETRTEEQIKADEEKWKNLYVPDFTKMGLKILDQSVSFDRDADKKISSVKSENNVKDSKVVAIDSIGKSATFLLRNKQPIYLADTKSGQFFRISCENGIEFKIEPVDELPEVYSDKVKNAYSYTNEAFKTLNTIRPRMGLAFQQTVFDHVLREAYDDFVKTVDDSLENFSEENKQKVLDAAKNLSESCDAIQNDKLKNFLKKEIDSLESRFTEAEKSNEKAIAAARGVKSDDFDVVAAAVKDHEAYAEVEKIVYKEKPVGDRNLETNVKLSPAVKAIEKNVEANPELKATYGKALDALKALDSYSQELYARDEDGKLPVFDEEKQGKFFKLSSDVFSALDVKVDTKALHTNLKKAFDDIEKMVGLDVSAISEIIPDGKSSLADHIGNSEIVNVNADNKDFDKVGAASNTRIAMSVTKNGQTKLGFFTKEVLFAPDLQLFYDAASKVIDEEEIPDEYIPAIKDSITNMLTSNKLISSSLSELTAEYVEINGLDGVAPTEDDISNASKYINKIETNSKFEKLWNEYFTKYSQYQSSIHADAGTNITNRNVAMSKIAALLGVSHLLAKSEKMEITEGDKVISGVFMENAEGKSYDDIMPEDAAKLDEHPFDNPTVLRDLADMQVLDFICQNIDRHQHNLFYKFSEDGKKIIGVQGIDNDLSFGNAPKEKDSDMLGPADVALKDITVITKSMYDKIKDLHPHTVLPVLSGLGLSKNEQQNALKRIQTIVNRVDEKRIKVVPDAAFSEMTINELAQGKTSGSLFARCNAMDKNIKTIAKTNQKKESKEENSINFEKVEQLGGTNKEQIKKDASKADEFGEKIRISQKSIWGSGSGAFKGVEIAMKNFAEIAKTMPETPERSDLLKYQAAMESALENANEYLKFKGEKSGNKKTQNRINIAKDIKTYFSDRLQSFKKQFQKNDEIDVENLNASMKAMANKISGVQNQAKVKADNELGELHKNETNQNMINLKLDGKLSRMKLNNVSDGTIEMLPKEIMQKHLAKIVLNDIIIRERLENNGLNFKLDENTAKTYVKGNFEKAVEAGKTEELITAISNLDSIQKAAVGSPETIGKYAKNGGASEIASKALKDLKLSAKQKTEVNDKVPVKDNVKDKEVKEDFIKE